jgi:HrpA-like RNA helicase
VAELRRTPLDELCLQAKLFSARLPVADFLSQAPEPPLHQSVHAAVTLLKDIGAMDADEHLTVLGHHLAALPMSPRLGKLVIFGLAFDCVDPILTIACAMSYRCVQHCAVSIMSTFSFIVVWISAQCSQVRMHKA